jgi:hypothetical protein
MKHCARRTPPTEKSQPWPPDINHSPRGGDSPVKALPLEGNPPEYVHADTLAGIRAKLSGDPQQFVALDFEDRRSRAMFCAVA